VDPLVGSPLAIENNALDDDLFTNFASYYCLCVVCVDISTRTDAISGIDR